MIVGFFGTLVNSIVFSMTSEVSFLNALPLPWLFNIAPWLWFLLGEVTWSWGIGVLAGFIFNFILDKKLVFKA
jgi:putative flippase GtrA